MKVFLFFLNSTKILDGELDIQAQRIDEEKQTDQVGKLASKVHRLYKEDTQQNNDSNNNQKDRVKDLTEMIYNVFSDTKDRKNSAETQLNIDTLLQNKSEYLHTPSSHTQNQSKNSDNTDKSKGNNAFIVSSDHFLDCDDSSFYYSSSVYNEDFFIEKTKCRFATGFQEDEDSDDELDFQNDSKKIKEERNESIFFIYDIHFFIFVLI